jgi:hypothetical protein
MLSCAAVVITGQPVKQQNWSESLKFEAQRSDLEQKVFFSTNA